MQMKNNDNDEICLLLNSLIQHGPNNKRVYLMKLNSSDYPAIIDEIEKIVYENNYSKSFVKVSESYASGFLSNGYVCEGIIPGMFGGEEDGYFLSKFYDEKRSVAEQGIINDKILERRKGKQSSFPDNNKSGAKTSDQNKSDGNNSDEKISNGIKQNKAGILPDGFVIREAGFSDSEALAKLFKKTFESYPFPVDDPSYIKKTMDEEIIYFGIWKDDTLVSAASSETDSASKSVEMTDFATSEEFGGRGFAGIILDFMEEEMKNRGFITSYTIARAAFLPVNLLFYNRGYRFCGTLIKNTNICGSFESMNLWYKRL